MSRVIKFRAYRKKDNSIYDVFSFCKDYVKVIALNDTIIKYPIDEFEPLMQFTGLVDKNGVEIYEGDVVKKLEEDYSECDRFNGYDERWENPHLKEEKDVVSLDRFGYWLKNEEWGYEGEDLQNPKEYEVIGNIYQNPELLK